MGLLFPMVVEILESRIPGLKLVYLFGSQSTGIVHSESDVDLAVLGEEPLPAEERFTLCAEAGRLLHASVDLVDLLTASTVLTYQVVESGKLLFAESSRVAAEFEVTALSRYCSLNQERKDLLRDIQERGFIHAGRCHPGKSGDH